MLWLRGSCVSLEGREGEDSVDFAKTQTMSIKHVQDVVVKEVTILLLNTFRRDRVFPLSLELSHFRKKTQPSFKLLLDEALGRCTQQSFIQGWGGEGYP